MAYSPRRITRKDIRRPDPFIVLTGKLFDSFKQHRAKFLAAAITGVGIVLVLWSWDLYKDRQNRLAAHEFALALDLYHSNKYREALEALQRLGIYRSSYYSRLALLYQAHTHIALKDNAKAESVLQELLRIEKRDPFLRQLAFLNLAYNQERTGRCKEAVQSFSEAEALQAPFKEDALLGKARCSTQLGNFKEALNSYRQFILNYPSSERVKHATLLAQEMESKVSEVGAGK